MQDVTENGKTIRSVITELKSEARDFVSTRLAILTQEMKDKLKVWKAAIPLLAIAAVFGATGFLVLTFALVSFVAGVFEPSAFAWGYGGLIVAAVYFAVTFGLFYFARREINRIGMAPTRTLRVLKDDQVWIQNEARSQV